MAAGSTSRAPILVVDGHEGERKSACRVLAEAGYATGEAGTGAGALHAARRKRPQLVVLEVRLSDLCGYEVCRTLREEFGEEMPIIFVSGERTESFDRVAGLMIGADDYLTKPFAADELLARVRALSRRGAPVAAVATASLTKRELQVLQLVADGLRQSDIADQLLISEKTVETHVHHILTKLGARNRPQAVALAYRENLMNDR